MIKTIEKNETDYFDNILSNYKRESDTVGPENYFRLEYTLA